MWNLVSAEMEQIKKTELSDMELLTKTYESYKDFRDAVFSHATTTTTIDFIIKFKAYQQIARERGYDI